jgi:two-component sensor histidine kinase
MEALVRAAIAPFSSRQIAFSGPTCCVSRNGCTPLMMALHELGTNASKYGALSTESGRVEITWRVTAPPDGPVEVRWRESGGPAVSEPTRRGIGARLLAPTGDMRQVDLRYHRHGVACELTVEQA